MRSLVKLEQYESFCFNNQLSKGSKGTIIGKIIEVPAIMVRGANQTEVQAKLVEAFGHYQKELSTIAR